MKIRAWEQSDLTEIAQMEARCFSDPWSEDALASVLRYAWQHSFLLEDEGQVCGYGCLLCLFEDAEIANIAVDIPFRGKGYGGALLGAMLEKAKSLGASRALLEVRVSNATAIRLYEKFGFVKYGERKRYYEDGEDAALMEKKL